MIIVKGALIRGLNLGFYSFSLPVILFVTFSVYASVGGTLTPKRVFTTLSLVSLIRLTSVHFIVLASLTLSEARVAIQRIQVLYTIHTYCTVALVHSVADLGTGKLGHLPGHQNQTLMGFI